MNFQVEQIDHVETTVPDRYAAAKWYERVLGLRIIPELEFWADNPRGPLMIGTKEGGTKLALFEGQQEGSQRNIGFHLVAFRIGADAFLEFVAQLPALKLLNQRNETVTREMVSDHQLAFSIYFCDPSGNQLELTTYEYSQVKSKLNQLG